MIKTLYPCFQHWSEKGSVYLISDTHFDDPDREYMGYNISNMEQAYCLYETCHKNDTLIHLGDVGNPEWLKGLKCYKVLIMGNHDKADVKEYFDEVYTGPLWVAEKLVLSHEPIVTEDTYFGMRIAFNIHGHDHNEENKGGFYSLNLAQNVFGYFPLNLKQAIEDGMLKDITSIHRLTIDKAITNKETEGILHEWYTDTGVENV